MLNPSLYNALWRLTGSRPKVSRPGQRFRYSVLQDKRGVRIVPTSGEQYSVNCPFCGDTRGRLYVHYMFGLRLSDAAHPAMSGPLNQLAYCQNEQKCVPLATRLSGYQTWGAQLQVAELEASSSAEDDDGLFRPPPDPGTLVDLTADCDVAKSAAAYLAGRGFDPGYLTQHCGAKVCAAHPDPKMAKLLVGRSVWPFYVDGVQATWQARLSYDLAKGQKWPPKWWFPSGTKKVPWNYDAAARFETVIITEGILSAVNAGPAAIAIGGKSMTHMVKKLISSKWRSAIVMLDPDAGICRADLEMPDYQERAITELREAGVNAVGVSWTPGDLRDPGDLGKIGCASVLATSCPQHALTIPYLRDICCTNPT